MARRMKGWEPNPVNKNVEDGKWPLDLNSLRLERFYLKKPDEVASDDDNLLALVDRWGRI